MIKKIYPIFTILLGAAIYAFGLTYFVVPHHLFEGGGDRYYPHHLLSF